MYVNDALVNSAVALAGGGISGFLIGYALRKLIKFVMFAVGLLFVAVLYMQYQGFLAVKWDRINGALAGALHTNSTAIGGGETITRVVDTLGIPLTSGLGVGIIAGFLRG